jgi:DNA-binding CsgD family transcriptional regulator
VLIGQGRTSKEIGEMLGITERTADTHAAHIRDKLGLRSRAEIAAWVARQSPG